MERFSWLRSRIRPRRWRLTARRRLLRLSVQMTTAIGYARVSNADFSRVHDLQRDALTEAGVESDNYEDSASAIRTIAALTACLEALRRGDTLVVWKLDHLGLELRHLVNLVDDLTQRYIGLKCWPVKARRSTHRPLMAAWCLGCLQRLPSSNEC